MSLVQEQRHYNEPMYLLKGEGQEDRVSSEKWIHNHFKEVE